MTPTQCEKCPHISTDGWTTHCHLMHKDIDIGEIRFTTQRHMDCPFDKEQSNETK